MKVLTLILLIGAVLSKERRYWFLENFDNDISKRWVNSIDPKYEDTFTHDLENGKLKVGDSKKNFGIISEISPPINNENKPLIIQFELKYQRDVECTGGYIKLIYDNAIDDLESFNSDTTFAIMFGADICKYGKEKKDKVVFYYNHYNEKCGKYRTVKFTRPPKAINDNETHLYMLKLMPDNTFEIYIDMEKRTSGNFFKEFEPSITPKRFFKKNDKRMSKPRNIPNKCYYIPETPYKMNDIGAVAIDIYSGYSSNTTFDNILLTWDYDFAIKYAEKTWGRTHTIETYERPFHYDDDFEVVWDGPEVPEFDDWNEDEL